MSSMTNKGKTHRIEKFCEFREIVPPASVNCLQTKEICITIVYQTNQ